MTSARTGRVAAPLLLLPSLVWILTDHRVWPWDQAWYGEVSADLWSTLVLAPAGWMTAMLHALGSKPPVVAWIGQAFAPLHPAVGWEAALLLSVLATHAAALLFLHGALARLFGRWSPAAWAGVLTVAASPLFIGMTHQYFAEPAQLLSVCLFLWIAVRRNAMGRLRLFAWLAIATAAALAAKTTSPIYVFGFGLVALAALVRRPAEPAAAESRAVTAILVIAAAALVALTAGWYVVNAEHTLKHALQSASGSVALHYGSVADFSTKLAFWLAALQGALLLPDGAAAAVMAGALLLFLAVRRVLHGHGGIGAAKEAGMAIPAAAAAQIVTVLCAFSLNINEESRFLLPLFPSVAVLVATAVAAAGTRAAGIPVLAFLILQWGAAHAMALGWVPLRAGSPWLLARHTDDARVTTIARLATATCPPASAGRINLIATERSWLNANTLAFFSARSRVETGWRCHYTGLGYAETDLERAWERLQSMKVDFVVTLDSDRTEADPDFLNRINGPIRHQLEADGGFRVSPFTAPEGITVFERVPTPP